MMDRSENRRMRCEYLIRVYGFNNRLGDELDLIMGDKKI